MGEENPALTRREWEILDGGTAEHSKGSRQCHNIRNKSPAENDREMEGTYQKKNI